MKTHRTNVATLFAGSLLCALVACGGESSDLGASDDSAEALTGGRLVGPGGNPMACADPTVLGVGASTRYIYCTSMSHVWVTTNHYGTFTDERNKLTFDLSQMPSNSKNVGAWWAPTVAFDGKEYVMWVSVPDNIVYKTDTRSLAVLKSPTPLGPWKFIDYASNASAEGQMIIDPMLFENGDGHWYVFWKRYGGGLSSSIMGGAVNATLDGIGFRKELLKGYGDEPKAWEGNVRENPDVWEDKTHHRWHLLFSGNAYKTAQYGTGHAVSTNGPLGDYNIVESGNQGIHRVVQTDEAAVEAKYAHGGPGGATWRGGSWMIFAAASNSALGDTTRYLHMEPLSWANDAPYVNTFHHRPH